MKIFWDISYYCNGQCIYCFTNSTNQKLLITNSQLEKAYSFFEQIKATEISIGGGEPFLSDFTRVCSGLKSDMRISVTTNGTVYNEEIVRMLKEKSIKVTISMDSLQLIYYETVRKGLLLSNILDTIQRLVKWPEIRSNLSLRTTLNVHNIAEAKDIVDFCINNHIPRLKVNTTNLYGRAKNNRNLVLEFNEFLRTLKEIESYAKEFQDVLKMELPIKKYLDGKTQSCTLGNNSLYLAPDGGIYPCAFCEGHLCMGNIYEDSIENIIKTVSIFTHKNSVCQSCPVRRYENEKCVLEEGQ